MKILRIFIALVAAVVLVVGAALAWFFVPPSIQRAEEFSRMVAVSWGDGKYGKATYGAYVFYEPQADGQLQVKLRVHIYRGSTWLQYRADDRLIGIARNPADAVDKWGVIAWSEAGITVGRPENAYLFPRAELERHR